MGRRRAAWFTTSTTSSRRSSPAPRGCYAPGRAASWTGKGSRRSPTQRGAADRALKLSGYRVHTAPDGERGLEAYQRLHEELDLVVVDLVMPGLGGAACLRTIQASHPEMPVLITTDRPSDETIQGALAAGACGVVSKPCEEEALVAAVRDALATGRQWVRARQ